MVEDKKVEKDSPDSKKDDIPTSQKGFFGKIKDTVVPDAEEQAAIVSQLVRLGILIWSGGILTLNYVTIPGFPQGKIDPTFIASVFTGVLATFGVQTAKNKQNGGTNGGGVNITKKDMEMLIAKAAEAAPAQTLRIEQAPLVIAPTVPPAKGTKPPVPKV